MTRVKAVTSFAKTPLASVGMTGWTEHINQQAYTDTGYSGKERLEAGRY